MKIIENTYINLKEAPLAKTTNEQSNSPGIDFLQNNINNEKEEVKNFKSTKLYFLIFIFRTSPLKV